MARKEILYFLKDIAQEGMIKSLVKLVSRESLISESILHHNIRSARGGSRVLREFDSFIKDTRQASPSDIDLLIVSIDGNSKGYHLKLKEIRQIITENHPYKDKVIFAIPDPHIERWYIMDQRAFKQGVGVKRAPDMPAYKCDKDYYKKLLHQTLGDSDIKSLLGGSEYAESIVENIKDLDALKDIDIGFDNFIAGLRSFFRPMARH